MANGVIGRTYERVEWGAAPSREQVDATRAYLRAAEHADLSIEADLLERGAYRLYVLDRNQVIVGVVYLNEAGRSESTEGIVPQPGPTLRQFTDGGGMPLCPRCGADMEHLELDDADDRARCGLCGVDWPVEYVIAAGQDGQRFMVCVDGGPPPVEWRNDDLGEPEALRRARECRELFPESIVTLVLEGAVVEPDLASGS